LCTYTFTNDLFSHSIISTVLGLVECFIIVVKAGWTATIAFGLSVLCPNILFVLRLVSLKCLIVLFYIMIAERICLWIYAHTCIHLHTCIHNIHKLGIHISNNVYMCTHTCAHANTSNNYLKTLLKAQLTPNYFKTISYPSLPLANSPIHHILSMVTEIPEHMLSSIESGHQRYWCDPNTSGSNHNQKVWLTFYVCWMIDSCG
jgi:hypothetical protein